MSWILVLSRLQNQEWYDGQHRSMQLHAATHRLLNRHITSHLFGYVWMKLMRVCLGPRCVYIAKFGWDRGIGRLVIRCASEPKGVEKHNTFSHCNTQLKHRAGYKLQNVWCCYSNAESAPQSTTYRQPAAAGSKSCMQGSAAHAWKASQFNLTYLREARSQTRARNKTTLDSEAACMCVSSILFNHNCNHVIDHSWSDHKQCDREWWPIGLQESLPRNPIVLNTCVFLLYNTIPWHVRCLPPN